MKGSFDVLYTLDYLEAEASKGLSAEDKMSYFKKIMPITSTGSRTWVDYRNTAVKPTHKSEEIQELTLEDAKKLTDIDSLIDNHILVNRYINGIITICCNFTFIRKPSNDITIDQDMIVNQTINICQFFGIF